MFSECKMGKLVTFILLLVTTFIQGRLLYINYNTEFIRLLYTQVTPANLFLLELWESKIPEYYYV